MPGLNLAHAIDRKCLDAGVAWHRNQFAILGDAAGGIADGHLAPAKDDLVVERTAGHGRNAAALDVHLVDRIQLLGQIARHDLGETGLDAAAGDDQDARLCGRLLQCIQLIGWRPTQIDPGRASSDGCAQPQGDGGVGQRRHDHVVVAHEVNGGLFIGQVELDCVNFVAAVQLEQFAFGGCKLFSVQIAERDLSHIRIAHGVEGGGRSHQPAAQYENFHAAS